MKTKLLCDTMDISGRVKSLKKHIEFEGKNIIGNVAASEYTAVIENKDGYLDEAKLNKTFTIINDDKVFDTVYAYDYPQELFDEITITFYDAIAKTNAPFLTDIESYPKTIHDVIVEMSARSNVPIDDSLVHSNVLNKVVNTYDSNIMIRSYLGWIAELSACNVMCSPNGVITFFPIQKEYTKSITEDRYVYEFKTGANFICTQVMFDNGLKVVKKGTEEKNTIYISEDNLYISDDETQSQAQIDLVYDLVYGISFRSVTGLKMRYIDDIRLGEIIHYKEYFDCMALSYDLDFYNGDVVHHVLLLDGDVDTTAKEKAIVIASSEFRKKINVVLNNQEQKLSIVAEATNDNLKNIGELELDVNGIKGTVEAVKEENGALIEKTNELSLTVDGLSNRVTTTGGNNLVKDSMGVFGDGFSGNYYIDKSLDIQKRNLYGFAIRLANDSLYQSISVPNGSYTLSFSYCKWIALAAVSIVINGKELPLSNTAYTQFKHTFSVDSGTIDITFRSDTDMSCTIVNLMLNQGSEAMIWSLNANETWTESVKMSSSGITIESSGADVLFSAKADIIGFKNKNTSEYVAVFTDVGATMKELTVKNKAKIVGLLFQEINGQTVINKLGGGF